MNAARCLAIALLLVCGLRSGASVAEADTGAVVLMTVAGPYRITVFADPMPLRVGPIDLSVLVQDAGTGAVFSDCRVDITLHNEVDPTQSVAAEATTAAATNKLLRSALLTVPSTGVWQADISVSGVGGTAKTRLALNVAPPPAAWHDTIAWVLAPAAFILLYVLREIAIAGRGKRLPRASLSSRSPSVHMRASEPGYRSAS